MGSDGLGNVTNVRKAEYSGRFGSCQLSERLLALQVVWSSSASPTRSQHHPYLSASRDAGGKTVSLHGLADKIVPPEGTGQYYRCVGGAHADIPTFYLHYEVLGLGHCFGGRRDVGGAVR